MREEVVEIIPLAAWIWLWAALTDELGPERAADLCAELRRRMHCDPQFDSVDLTTCAMGRNQ